MTQTIEFTTKIHQGNIVIPQEYAESLQENLEIEVIVRPKIKKRLLDELAKYPVSAAGWRKLNRDQIHDRG